MDSVLDGISKKLNLQSDLLASDISGNELRVSKGNESTATSKESVPSPAKNGKKRKSTRQLLNEYDGTFK